MEAIALHDLKPRKISKRAQTWWQYRVVQKKGNVMLSISLAGPAVAGCSRAETFSQLSAISFAQPCTVYNFKFSGVNFWGRKCVKTAQFQFRFTARFRPRRSRDFHARNSNFFTRKYTPLSTCIALLVEYSSEQKCCLWESHFRFKSESTNVFWKICMLCHTSTKTAVRGRKAVSYLYRNLAVWAGPAHLPSCAPAKVIYDDLNI